MILVVLSTLIDCFSDIFWKKSLWFGVWWKVHDLMSYPIWLMIVWYFLYTWVDLSQIDYFLVISILFITLLAIFNASLYQKIYTKDKISVIMPYTNVNKILTIIFSFILFSDVSITSLIITIIAVFVIIWFSINYKSFKFPKSTKMIFLVEFLAAIENIWAWYLIVTYSEVLYFIVFVLFWIVLLTWIALYLWEFKTLKWLNKSFFINRYIWAMWWISWFLWLVVIKNLWLSISILLSFLWIWITLLFSYIILKDKPSKKDIILTTIVSILVWLWYYFQ